VYWMASRTLNYKAWIKTFERFNHLKYSSCWRCKHRILTVRMRYIEWRAEHWITRLLYVQFIFYWEQQQRQNLLLNHARLLVRSYGCNMWLDKCVWGNFYIPLATWSYNVYEIESVVGRQVLITFLNINDKAYTKYLCVVIIPLPLLWN
jgi:hypothetical protein